jgi:hypothetical protein
VIRFNACSAVSLFSKLKLKTTPPVEVAASAAGVDDDREPRDRLHDVDHLGQALLVLDLGHLQRRRVELLAEEALRLGHLLREVQAAALRAQLRDPVPLVGVGLGDDVDVGDLHLLQRLLPAPELLELALDVVLADLRAPGAEGRVADLGRLRVVGVALEDLLRDLLGLLVVAGAERGDRAVERACDERGLLVARFLLLRLELLVGFPLLRLLGGLLGVRARGPRAVEQRLRLDVEALPVDREGRELDQVVRDLELGDRAGVVRARDQELRLADGVLGVGAQLFDAQGLPFGHVLGDRLLLADRLALHRLGLGAQLLRRERGRVELEGPVRLGDRVVEPQLGQGLLAGLDVRFDQERPLLAGEVEGRGVLPEPLGSLARRRSGLTRGRLGGCGRLLRGARLAAGDERGREASGDRESREGHGDRGGGRFGGEGVVSRCVDVHQVHQFHRSRLRTWSLRGRPTW